MRFNSVLLISLVLMPQFLGNCVTTNTLMYFIVYVEMENNATNFLAYGQSFPSIKPWFPSFERDSSFFFLFVLQTLRRTGYLFVYVSRNASGRNAIDLFRSALFYHGGFFLLWQLAHKRAFIFIGICMAVRMFCKRLAFFSKCLNFFSFFVEWLMFLPLSC